MCNQDRYSIIRRLVASTLFCLGAMVPAVQAAEGIAQPDTEPLLILAATHSMERWQDRREDRRETRGDCRDDEGLVGKDRRDRKQDGRQEPGEDDEDQD